MLGEIPNLDVVDQIYELHRKSCHRQKQDRESAAVQSLPGPDVDLQNLREGNHAKADSRPRSNLAVGCLKGWLMVGLPPLASVESQFARRSRGRFNRQILLRIAAKGIDATFTADIDRASHHADGNRRAHRSQLFSRHGAKFLCGGSRRITSRAGAVRLWRGDADVHVGRIRAAGTARRTVPLTILTPLSGTG